MPYAANGMISRSPIEGGIEITEEQYMQVLAWQLAGDDVTIIGGFQKAPKPEPETPELPEPEPKPIKIFSVREFRARFTQEEQLDIRAASMTDHEVGLVYDEFLSAQYINLDDPAVEQGVDLYIAKGLIDPSRKPALLAPGEQL